MQRMERARLIDLISRKEIIDPFKRLVELIALRSESCSGSRSESKRQPLQF
jgi:hypothetical protein